MKRPSCLVSTVVLVLFLTACGDSGNDAAGAPDESTVTGGDSLFAALPADSSTDGATFQTLDGRGFDFDYFAGKKVFVNFWATWCAPCIREIPSINQAAQTLSPEGYVFLFASDESVETIQEFLADRQFGGNFVKLNNYFGSYGIGAVPSSWLVDENGQVAVTWAGAYEWDTDDMLEQIRNP